MENRFTFFKESIKNIKTIGTIMPSSRFLINKMLKDIDFNNAKIIVEYGPGNGNITKTILDKMHPKAQLICFEINEKFYNQLIKIKDSRLTIVKESALNVNEVINTKNVSNVDCFVSSLPLSLIPKEISLEIINKSKNLLTNKGLFIQYQYSINFLKDFKQIFHNKNVVLALEVLNLPPAFIYKCKKD